MEKYNGLTVTAPEGAADTSSLTADAAAPGGELPRRGKRGHPGVSPQGEGFEVEQSSKNGVSFNCFALQHQKKIQHKNRPGESPFPALLPTPQVLYLRIVYHAKQKIARYFRTTTTA